MKRRDFIRTSVGAGIALSALPALDSVGMRALAYSPALRSMQMLAGATDRVFVLIQLTGGNDGLNTLIPIENSIYYNQRPTIGIQKNDALPLTSTLGWHPSMAGMKQLYDDGKIAIVQGVTYPNPNRSHFRGTDIWLTASDEDVFLSTGWVGRYLESIFPDYPDVLPTDPMAIQIGSALSLEMISEKGGMAVTFTDPLAFYQLVGEGTGSKWPEPPHTPAGDELDYIRTIAEASEVYAKRIKESVGTNKATYPDNNNLAKSLKVVAQLISGGLNTRFYLVNISGNSFDTHQSQGGTTGKHADLLAELSDAVKAFMDDLELLGHADRVSGMTFSEFGRRVEENGSAGTDHGTAAPLFVFGKNVIGHAIHGADPDLSKLDDRGDILMQNDFRQIYASVLAQWFTTPQSEIHKLLYNDFNTLPLFQQLPSAVQDSSVFQSTVIRNYPNPFNNMTTIEYTLLSQTFVTLSVLDIQGRTLARLVAEDQSAGTYRIPFSSASLPSGSYFYRIQAGRFTDTRKMEIVR